MVTLRDYQEQGSTDASAILREKRMVYLAWEKMRTFASTD
jgi:hypothetical protein